nr:HYR domain-containing protein [uncultured Acetobacterium sp.]
MTDKLMSKRQSNHKKVGLKTLVMMLSLLMIFSLSAFDVFADSSGPRSPGFVSSQNYVTFRGVWVNKPYAMTSDNVYTTAAVTNAQEYTEWLKAGNYGFTIPANATITGIQANVERKQVITENVPGTTLGMYDFMACLMINGTIVTTSNIVADAIPYYWPSNEEVKTFGGPTSLWGLSLTPADVNNGNFGFAILPKKAYLVAGYPYVTAYPWVDYMSMTVYYTLPSTDTSPPVIAAQSNMFVEATSANGAIVNFAPTATDNVDPSVTVVTSPASGSQFPIGTTTVTCNATDLAGNPAIPVTFDVIVQDTTAPVINLTGNDAVNLNQNLTYTEEGATWTDAVDGNGAAIVGGDVVNTSIPGTYLVTYDYTDTAGNPALQVTRTVNILDTIPPVIAAQSDMIVEATSANGAIVSFTPTATDNFDPSVTVTTTPASGSQFTLGTTQVTCNAVDLAGNAAVPITFNVTVVDTTAPVITLTGNNPYSIHYASTYTEPGAIWNDVVDGTGSAAVGGQTVNTLIPGNYVITYNYTDAAGNPAIEVTRTVTVEKWATIVVSTDVKNWKGMNVIDPHLFTIQLDGSTNQFISQTLSATYDHLAPGTYTIMQLIDSKYVLKSITGDNDAIAANGATITVGSGQTANLTFVNWKFQPNKK